jgi:5'-nucleotidase
MNYPLILITNDDGIESPGLRYLIKIMNNIGKVVVIAPDKPQSAQSHAITIDKPIRCDKVIIDDGKQLEFKCSGTPVDCIKLAFSVILDRKPDICISGINHGSNSSTNVIYSGTVSAAMEAYLNNIPSIAFSLLDHSIDADFSQVDNFIIKITRDLLESKIVSCLNVNFPKTIYNNPIKGIKVCHQAEGRWIEEFDERFDPKGDKYFWLTGKFVNNDKSENSDQNLLEENFVTVVPVKYDLTNVEHIELINKLLNE